MQRVSQAPQLALTWRRRLGVLAMLTLVAFSAPAWAIDSARTAVTLVQQAAKSYESGDFVKAADLYQKAFRLDPSPAYLWALARSEHLAGLNEGAIEHYHQFIANPGAETARVPRAQAYLADVEQEVNKTRLREADAASRSGNPALAAELYLQAYKTAPTRLDWLFKAAVAEQMAEAWEPALQHLDSYLALAPPHADERMQAQTRELWLRQKLGLKPLVLVERPVPGVAQPAAVGQMAMPDSGGHDTPRLARSAELKAPPAWPGWATIGIGAVALAGGVVLLIGAESDAAQLTREQNHDAGQLITGLSRETALNRASAINTRAAVGWTATGVGLAASGFGVWWLTQHPAQAAVILPTPNGALLAVRF